MKRLVGLIVMVASLGISAGTAHADKPVACLWPYVGNGNGLCIYMPNANAR